MKNEYAILSGSFASAAGYAAYSWMGNPLAGFMVCFTIEAIGFFMLWAAEIIAKQADTKSK
jgi:hypothetical protein